MANPIRKSSDNSHFLVESCHFFSWVSPLRTGIVRYDGESRSRIKCRWRSPSACWSVDDGTAQADSTVTETFNESPDVVSALATAFGRELTANEWEGWQEMSPKQRERAIARIAALRDWVEGDRNETATEVADRLGMKVKRFYNMVSAWRRTPTLSALGTFSRTGGRASRLDANAVNALQGEIPAVVGASKKGATVEELRLESEARVASKLGTAGLSFSMPSKNIVRAMVRREQDRRGQERLLGGLLRMDCVGTSLVRKDGLPHVIAVIMERGIGVVLGFAIVDKPGEAGGYAAAAKDALERGIPSIIGGVWADGVERIDMVPINDTALRLALRHYYELPGHPEIGFTKSGAFGRYARPMLGERVGRTLLRPVRLAGRPVVGDEDAGRFSVEEALVRLRLDFSAHNEAGLREMTEPPGGAPPDILLLALDAISRAI